MFVLLMSQLLPYTSLSVYSFYLNIQSLFESSFSSINLQYIYIFITQIFVQFQALIFISLTEQAMQTDSLLQQWKQAKQSCRKIIDISIRANILKLPSQKQSKQQFIKIYDIVYKLCSSPVGEETRVPMVYKDFKEILKNGLIIMSKNLFEERDIHKLSLLRRIFDAFEDSLKRIRHMFAILDRQMIIKENKTEELDKTGISILVTTLFGQQSLQQYSAIYFKHLNKIRKTRDLSDSGTLRDYAEILYKFHMRLSKKQVKKARTLYTDFQQSYLANAKQYYTSLYHKLQQLSPSEYFLQVNDLYEFEKNVTQECFGFTSDSFINKTFSNQFLQEYRRKLIQSSKGLKYILQNREIQIITLITNLYKKLTNSIEGFKQPFESFIYDEIASLLSEVQIELATKKSESISLNFIQKLIKKNSELLQTLEVSFTKFKQFIGFYKSGMEKAFSKNILQIPIQQMLAYYVDSKFRVPFGSQDSMKEQIGHVKNLFECIENKDMFLLKYLQKLAKKIITITPQGVQNHQTLIYFLKLHSGNQITEKLQKIIDEFKISLENQKEFKDVQVHERLSYTMTLHVFSEADWPFPEIIEFKYEEIPAQFQRGFDCINIYAKQKYQRKTLRILLNDSRMRWIYYFDEEVDNKIKEAFFTTTGLQALILSYIYQQRPQAISLKVLCHIFQQIKPVLLKQALKRLSHHESPILLMKQSNEEELYQFNSLMKSKRHMIQYNNVGEQFEEEQMLFQKKELNREREFAVDANVAKLMKVKKILGFERIVEEVSKMVKVFNPSVRDIKNSVERLLGKDVLIRDEKDKNTIRYKD